MLSLQVLSAAARLHVQESRTVPGVAAPEKYTAEASGYVARGEVRVSERRVG